MDEPVFRLPTARCFGEPVPEARCFGVSVFRCFGGPVDRWTGGPVWRKSQLLCTDSFSFLLPQHRAPSATKTPRRDKKHSLEKTMKKANSVRELETYQAVFSLQQEIFQVSKTFPKEEMYSLTDQIRRASRSIGANLSESWAKRRYPAHFLSKLTDADGELQETQHWLATAEACEYLTPGQATAMQERAAIVGRQLGSMINCYESFCF